MLNIICSFIKQILRVPLPPSYSDSLLFCFGSHRYIIICGGFEVTTGPTGWYYWQIYWRQLLRTAWIKWLLFRKSREFIPGSTSSKTLLVKYRLHSLHGPIIGCFSVVPETRLPGGEPMVLRTTLHRNAPAILNNESENRNISFLYLVTSLIIYPDIKYGINKWIGSLNKSFATCVVRGLAFCRHFIWP